MAEMRCLFRYCFNRVLSREMGYSKSATFRRNNISFLRLRYMSHDSLDIKEPALKHDNESVMTEDLDPVHIAPQPICTKLSGLVDDYGILQKFVDLGVDIRTFEKDLGLCGKILRFDFDTHVVPYLTFLVKHGVPEEELGNFITANPRIFFSDLDNLQIRVNYLYSKKFNKNMIATIITKNPKWLSHEVIFVDKFLGELQQELRLSGDNVREIVVKYPSILKVRSCDIRLNLHMFKNTLSIDSRTLKSLVVEVPKLLRMNNNDIMETYFYLTDTMSVSPDVIIAQPKILLFRAKFIKTKHLFLKKLGKNQYNPKLPGYVSIMDLATADDKEFAEKIAMTDVQLYFDFQKTL